MKVLQIAINVGWWTSLLLAIHAAWSQEPAWSAMFIGMCCLVSIAKIAARTANQEPKA